MHAVRIGMLLLQQQQHLTDIKFLQATAALCVLFCLFVQGVAAATSAFFNVETKTLTDKYCRRCTQQQQPPPLILFIGFVRFVAASQQRLAALPLQQQQQKQQ